jgi:hypothetical protein
VIRWVNLILGCLAVAALARADSAQAPIALTIETPTHGSTIGGAEGLGFIAGRVVMQGAEPLDLVIAVDVSESTSESSGFDLDGDGEPPPPTVWGRVLGRAAPLDPGDSILAVELAATADLIKKLDPASSRVALVTYAGTNDRLRADALVETPLTFDFSLAERGLAEIARGGSAGMTDITAALELARRELLGARGATSHKRDGVRRAIALFGDGLPTLPKEGSIVQNAQLARSEARRAADAGIRVLTFYTGKLDPDRVKFMTDLALAGGGDLTRIGAHDIGSSLADVDLAAAELSIRNDSAAREATRMVRQHDGIFAALVPMRDGENDLELRARRADGSLAVERLSVRFDPSAAEVIPPELESLRYLLR